MPEDIARIALQHIVRRAMRRLSPPMRTVAQARPDETALAIAVGFSVLTQLYQSHDARLQKLAELVVTEAASKVNFHAFYDDPVIKSCAELLASE